MRMNDQDNDGACNAAFRPAVGTMCAKVLRDGKNSADKPIRPRARNDDEGLRHEARQPLNLELRNAVGIPASVSEDHSACGPDGSNRCNPQAAVSNAIR